MLLCLADKCLRQACFPCGDFDELFIVKGDGECICKLFGDQTAAGAVFPPDGDDIGHVVSSFHKALGFSVKENG